MNHALALRTLALSMLTAGCAGSLPEPIYVNQLDAYFPPEAPAETETAPGGTVGGEASGDVGAGAGAPGESAPVATAGGIVTTDTGVGAETAAIAEPVLVEPAPVDVGAEEAMVSLRHEAELCAARLNGHRSTAEVVGIIQGVISGFGSAVGSVGGVLSAIDWGNRDVTTAMGVMGSIGAGITLVGNLVIGFFANPVEELRLHGLGLRSWELAVELQLAHGDESAVRESLERCTRDEGPPVRVVGAGVAFSL